MYGVDIHYLYNSGFAVETEKHLMIFDYYLDDGGSLSEGAINVEDLQVDKPVIVFVSHRHPDHFNPAILEWRNHRPDIIYILSSDIKRKLEYGDAELHKMKPYTELTVSEARVRTFGSTDIGVSFLVEVDGVRLFHAGDLNWWWWNENTEQENKSATGMFKAEIERIQGNEVDIAFFPVDKRQEEAFHKGAEYFIQKIGPKVLVPMHFREAFEATTEFSKLMKEQGSKTEIVTISERGQRIKL